MSPSEAWKNPGNVKLKLSNGKDSKYSKEFVKGTREKFEKNDSIVIKREENISNPKSESNYEEEGIVIKILENDSYLIKSKKGKIMKRNHSQITKNFSRSNDRRS
jgi:hypothetical protein